MARYLPRDADFALPADDLRDEDLPRPRERDHPWVRHTLRPASGVLVLALVGAGLARTRGDDPPAPEPVQQVARPNDLAALGITVHTPVYRSANSLITDDLGGACPRGRSCVTSTDVPAAVLAALRAAYPAAADVTVRTVSLDAGAGSHLVARVVRATSHYCSITVQLTTGRIAAARGMTGSGEAAIAYDQRALGPLSVTVTVNGPQHRPTAGGPLARLADDPRIAAVG